MLSAWIFLIKVALVLQNKVFEKLFIMLSRKIFFFSSGIVLNTFHGEYTDIFRHFATFVSLTTQSSTLQDTRQGVPEYCITLPH